LPVTQERSDASWATLVNETSRALEKLRRSVPRRRIALDRLRSSWGQVSGRSYQPAHFDRKQCPGGDAGQGDSAANQWRPELQISDHKREDCVHRGPRSHAWLPFCDMRPLSCEGHAAAVARDKHAILALEFNQETSGFDGRRVLLSARFPFLRMQAYWRSSCCPTRSARRAARWVSSRR